MHGEYSYFARGATFFVDPDTRATPAIAPHSSV